MQSVHFDSEADCRHTFFSSWVRICLTSGFNLSNVEFLNVLSTWLNYCYHYRYYYHNHYHNLTFPTMYSNHRPSAIRSSAHITTKMMNRKITSKPKRKNKHNKRNNKIKTRTHTCMCIYTFIPCSVLILASDWLTTVRYGAVSHVWRHQREI